MQNEEPSVFSTSSPSSDPDWRRLSFAFSFSFRMDPIGRPPSRSPSALVQGHVHTGPVGSQLQLADVHVALGSCQQRFKHKRLRAVRAKLTEAIDSNGSLTVFGTACWRFKKLLRVGNCG